MFQKFWQRHVDFAALLSYSLLAVMATYPLIFHFTSAIPGHGADDPYLAWNIWWVKWSLLDLQSNPLWSNFIFYPIGVNLGTYTLTLLNGVLSIPLQLAWDVIPANNLIVLGSIVLAAFGARLVVADLLGRETRAARVGAWVAGLVYGFASYRFGYLYLGHLNFNSNAWLPYYALFLRRIFLRKSSAPRAGFFAGLFFVFAGWSESTFAAFLALLSAFYFFWRVLVERARVFRKSVFVNLGALGGVALLGLSPLMLAVGADLTRYGDFLLRGSGGAEFLSADLLSFFIPSQYNSLFGFVSKNLAFHNMDLAFVGYVTLALAIVGVTMPRARGEFVFWAVAALLVAAVMLGPVLHIFNQTVPDFVWLPFRLLQTIPLLRANRLPVRYDHLLMLAMSILAGGGTFILLKRFEKYKALIVLIPAFVLVEHLCIPISLSDLTAPAIYQTIAREPGDFSILDLPLGWSSSTLVQGQLYTQSQFYQAVHHKRLLSGNTSRPLPFTFQYFNELPVIHSLILLEKGEALDAAAQAEDAQAAPELSRFFDLQYVIAQPDQTSASVLDYARQVFNLTPAPNEDSQAFHVVVPPARDLKIDHAQAVSRLYFGSEWGRVQSSAGMSFRWATASRAQMFVPLAAMDYQMCGMYVGARDGQRVQIRANEAVVGTLTLTTQWTRHCITLPAHVLRGGLATLVFESVPVSLADAMFADDRHVGQTGVRAPVDIAVTSAGFRAGKFASLTFNGREVYETKRGYTLMVIDPARAEIIATQRFDTFRDEAESARLAAFIQRLPMGTIVVGAVCDEASRNLTEDAVNTLGTLGIAFDLRAHFRASHAFIGVKGARRGTAVEDSDASFPANVSVGKNVTMPNVTFALGTIEFSAVVR